MRAIRLLLVLGLVLGLCGVAMAQEDMSEEDMKMMNAMIAAGTPGEHHDHLEMLVGDWEYDLTMWMPNSPEPMTLTGTMTAESLFEGRFIKETWKGDFMGQPFVGVGLTGYNNVAGEYQGIWMDNQSTMIMMQTGSCSDGGKTREMSGTMLDPMTGDEVVSRGTMTINDDGTVTMVGYNTPKGGEETKSMEMKLRPAS